MSASSNLCGLVLNMHISKYQLGNLNLQFQKTKAKKKKKKNCRKREPCCRWRAEIFKQHPSLFTAHPLVSCHPPTFLSGPNHLFSARNRSLPSPVGAAPASSAQQSIPNPDHTPRFDLPAGMVQKNRPKQASPRREQESDTKKGASDQRNRMKKNARSIRRMSELDHLESRLRRRHVGHEKTPLWPEGSWPSYMRPTTSSGARKGRLQVRLESPMDGGDKTSPSIPNRSRFSPPSSSSSSSSTTCASSAPSCNNGTVANKRARPPARKVLVGPLFPKISASRATCSSTIKDSRFPKELEIAPGATESQGPSVVKVCPHAHCSLNDHGPVPPSSSRRKTQKSMRLKTFRRRVAAKVDRPTTVPSPEDEVDDDFSVQIYAMPSEKPVVDRSDDTCPANRDDGGAGRIASVCEFGKSAEIRINNRRTSNECHDSELSFEENPEVESAEMNGKEEENSNLIGNDFDGRVVMGSEESSFDLPAPNSHEVELAEVNEQDENGSNDLEPEEISLGETAKTTDLATECIGEIHGDGDEAAQVKSEIHREPEAVGDMVTEQEEERVECRVPHGDTEWKLDGAACMMPQTEASEDEIVAGTCDQIEICSKQGESETDQLDEAMKNTKFTCTRKKTADDHDEEPRPFNPRAPNFLPVEPDPEDERVDLRHQVTDDRKNSEEWMIDSALQRIVGRLAPAREKNVELLVEAFETVVAPVPVCESQHNDHGSPVLAHAGPIQACS